MRGAKLEPSNPVLCRRFRLNANFGTRNFYFCGNFDLPAFFVRAELIKKFLKCAEILCGYKLKAGCAQYPKNLAHKYR